MAFGRIWAESWEKKQMEIKRWRDVALRLCAMGGEELATRGRQASAKRINIILARWGYDFSRNALKGGPTKPGNFVVAQESIGAVLQILQQRLPQQVHQIIEQAKRVCEHRFDLLGYQNLDCGGSINWHLDIVHNVEAPRKPFHLVRYLDFDEVGDSKVTWEINRHQHLVTLAKAYRLTRERRFADEILTQWFHWRDENPYPIGINWASSLEVALRSLSWIWFYYLLEGTDALPEEFRSIWLRAQAQNGRHIERYLSTYFSPNTHLLGEAVALFFLGTLCPELADADQWKSKGWDLIQRAAVEQVLADGFYFERSTYYHVYALDLFLHSAVLARANGIEIPKEFRKILERMLNALFLFARAGEPPSVGDDDGGRVFDPARNRGKHLIDPLATGAVLFHRKDFKTVCRDPREETVWLLGAQGLAEWDSLGGANEAIESAALEQAGLFFLTAGEPAAQLVINAGPQGSKGVGHGHADALSICLHAGGHPLLIDPGTLSYVRDNPERSLFRGTGMHNTLKLDNLDQAEIGGAFSWNSLTQAKVDQWVQGENFDLFVGHHDGYMRLVLPVKHSRWVVALKSGFFMVRDVLEGEGEHRLDISWHLGTDLERVEDDLFWIKNGPLGFALIPFRENSWVKTIRNEAWSPTYGRRQLSTVVNFSTFATIPTEFATLLLPTSKVEKHKGALTRTSKEESTPFVSSYVYKSELSFSSFYFSHTKKPWRCGILASDAEFVCWSRTIEEEKTALIFCNGTYIEIDGKTVMRTQNPAQRCELTNRGGKATISCSEREATYALDSAVLEKLGRLEDELTTPAQKQR